MKKYFFLLFILALSPMLAMADDSGRCGVSVAYKYTEADHTLTIQGSGPMSNYSSRSEAPWKTYRNEITTVIIGDGVTSIGGEAFEWCSNLTSVTIPNSLTYIGVNAFFDCSGLTSVTIPNSVTTISDYAFANCSGLTSVTIPNSVTSIGQSAFHSCSGLTSVTIPNSVTSIGNYPFIGCSDLSSIIVEKGNSNYDSRNDCNAIIETASNTLIVGCSTTVIPNSVTSIGSNAFSACTGLTSVDIPNSVTSIGDGAFDDCI